MKEDIKYIEIYIPGRTYTLFPPDLDKDRIKMFIFQKMMCVSHKHDPIPLKEGEARFVTTPWKFWTKKEILDALDFVDNLEIMDGEYVFDEDIFVQITTFYKNSVQNGM